MPLVNAFLKAPNSVERTYELSLAFCPSCFLVQLTHVVPPQVLFRTYVYYSSTSSSFISHCRKTAEEMIRRFALNRASQVVEIASNDGSFLQFFRQQDIPVLGIDPAKNIASVANKGGIPTLPHFFTSRLALTLVKKQNLSANLVFGANVLAHVPDVVDFLIGVSYILTRGGTAVFEFPYVRGLFEGKFDTIYHEHVYYYSLIALENLFQQAKLCLYDVEETAMQGGSLRIYVSQPGSHSIHPRVHALRTAEYVSGYDSYGTYAAFAQFPPSIKKEITHVVKHIHRQGKRIVAYGAPAKGMVLLNYLCIAKYLELIVDKAPAKQGLFTPGTHMRVGKPDEIHSSQPDYILVLCWNLIDEVMHDLRPFAKQGGKFIVPLPQVSII